MSDLRDRLTRQVRDHPGAVAVLGAARKPDTTYGELAAMAAGLQAEFAARGLRSVGILSTRRLEAYAAVLAAFMGGVKFVPMNPDLPRDRLEKIAAAGGVGLILADPTTSAAAADLSLPHLDIAACVPATTTAAALTCATPAPGAIAYQMFTSGSTGDPKGVPVSYGNLDHYVTGIVAALDIPAGGRFSQLFDLSFDLSLHDIFVGLSQGGTLCPASKIDLMMPHAYLAKKQIDVWFSVPMLAMLAAQGQGDAAVSHRLQMALFCGEPLPADYAAGFMAFLQPQAPLYNLYGPTEATIAFTAARFDPQETRFSTVPLGQPFGGNRIAVETEAGIVDAVADPAAGAVTGELLLGGPQVFDGYQPDTGVVCFVSAPDGTRYYRSGDLVRLEGDALIHLGRSDNQIKLRGYRIELGDIEAAVRRCFGCSATAAVVLGDGAAREIGLAYAADQPIADRGPLADHLPAYMHPGRWLRVEKMPININGKIDRKALRQMQWDD
jgi:D-alanine--poly(phosphoribitol) ligase subunit 1